MGRIFHIICCFIAVSVFGCKGAPEPTGACRKVTTAAYEAQQAYWKSPKDSLDGVRYDSLIATLDAAPCTDSRSQWFIRYQRTLSAYESRRFAEAESLATLDLAALEGATRSLQRRYRGRLYSTRGRARYRLGTLEASVQDYERAAPHLEALSWEQQYHAKVYGAETYLAIGDSASVVKARDALLDAQRVLESPAAPSSPHINDLRRQCHEMLAKLYADYADVAFPAVDAEKREGNMGIVGILWSLLFGLLFYALKQRSRPRRHSRYEQRR